jgi:signal transduction histidine kinase
MTVEPISLSRFRHARGQATEDVDPFGEETRHDALQAVGTILSLIAAVSVTAEDPSGTRTRLGQLETEVVYLRSLLHDTLYGADPGGDAVVDVADETRRLVSTTQLGWPGSLEVVGAAAAQARVGSLELRRILVNVLRNAMRAAGPEGQVRVTVSPEPEEVRIEVEDDGPGFGVLPVQHGIGLRSVRRLVRSAGGWVEDPGRGSLGGATVRIHLPAVASGVAS